MERVSDERVDDMIAVCRTWAGSFAKDAAEALTELRERRAAEKDYRKALEAAQIEIMRGYADADATRRDGE